MSDPSSSSDVRLAQAVRDACVRAALDAFQDASISGLCCAGAWEVAVGAMRTLDLEATLPRRADPGADDEASGDQA